MKISTMDQLIINALVFDKPLVLPHLTGEENQLRIKITGFWDVISCSPCSLVDITHDIILTVNVVRTSRLK